MQIQLGRREGILSPLVKTRGCYIFLGLNSRFQFMQRANQDIWGAHIQLKFHFSLLWLERTHVSLRTVLVTFRLHQSMELPSTSSLTNAATEELHWGMGRIFSVSLIRFLLVQNYTYSHGLFGGMKIQWPHIWDLERSCSPKEPGWCVKVLSVILFQALKALKDVIKIIVQKGTNSV